VLDKLLILVEFELPFGEEEFDILVDLLFCLCHVVVECLLLTVESLLESPLLLLLSTDILLH